MDLVIALENTDKPEGVHWIFRLLDIKEDGFLDKSTVSFFVQEAHNRMTLSGLDPIKKEDMLNEIYDLVNPKESSIITAQGFFRSLDLITSNVSDTVIAMLTDFTAFHIYDSRTTEN